MQSLIYFFLGALAMWVLNAIFVVLLEKFTSGVLWPNWATFIAVFPIMPFLLLIKFATNQIEKRKNKKRL